MNVGLVVPGFSAHAADWCIPALRHLARAMANTDDVRVIAVRYPYRRARYPIDGADVIALGGADCRGPRVLRIWRDAVSVIAAEHRRQPFDVLHAFWATESGLLAALAGRVLRIPTLVSLAGGELAALHDIRYGDQRLAWERLKVGLSLRLASAVSAGSRWLMELAAPHIPGSGLHRAPLGVDLTLFTPDGRAPDRSAQLVHVGTLTPVKDQVTLLRAFAALRHTESRATLELVGDGPLRGDLVRVAQQLGVAESVRFRGEIDHASLPEIYRGASGFVLSSRHEAQGMVALEAAACGLSVVGTRVGVIPELTDAAVPVGADAALARAMAKTLAAGPSWDWENLEQVRSEFGLQVCTERFRALYAAIG